MPGARFLLLVVYLAILHPVRILAAGSQPFEVLFADNSGRAPNTDLVLGSDGNYYGTTSLGGVSNHGTVFRITPSGDVTTLVSFSDENGSYPSGALVEGDDGNFYGSTNGGGPNSFGTVFRITPAGNLTTLVAFDLSNGGGPNGRLTKGDDGCFYGVTQVGGTFNYGTVFKATSSGELTTLLSFNKANGSSPHGLIKGSDGSFYGTSFYGGEKDHGTVFKVTPAGTLTTLLSFTDSNGTFPTGALTQGNDGFFYGTTVYGGKKDRGTVFKVTPDGVLTTLASFDTPTTGADPNASLLKGPDGNFYGTTKAGGANSKGTIYRMTPTGTLTTLFSFHDSNGSAPASGMIVGSDGRLYGTTSMGGTNGDGTIYRMKLDGTFDRLHSFSSNLGQITSAGVTEGRDGALYGVTGDGGASGNGAIVRMTPDGVVTRLASFNGANGSAPNSTLVEAADGNYYGTTYAGGASSYGTVFKLTPQGVLTTVVSFTGPNGRFPRAGLVIGKDGNLYGTTAVGAENVLGTVFKVTLSGEFSTIASFTADDGRYPSSALTVGIDGWLYGVTEAGGPMNVGTVFKVSTSGTLTILATFNQANGSGPAAPLVEGDDGAFYGTTGFGGLMEAGTIFKITPSGAFTSLASFNGTNGHSPFGGMVRGVDGNFYGMTRAGGAHKHGTIFKVKPSGELTTLHSFDGVVAEGAASTPIFGSDGRLFGTARKMAIWSLAVPLSPTVRSASPTGVTTSSATLHGAVNANSLETTATFEYGLTPAFGSSIAASPAPLHNARLTPISATLTGLAPHATYHYRLTATNSEGSRSTEGGTFQTAGAPPVATDDRYKIAGDIRNPISLAVLENDSDPDEDSLTISAVTQATFGTVTTDGNTLTYTPGVHFLGRDTFSYTISDGFDTAVGTVQLQPSTLGRGVLLSTSSEVPGAGEAGSGISQGALFKTFGEPSVNSTGQVAVTASYGTRGHKAGHSIFRFGPNADQNTRVATAGQVAPGIEGAIFSSFRDPLLNDSGDVAFIASVSGGAKAKRTEQGIWLSTTTNTGGIATTDIAHTETEPPGFPAGSRWKKFTSVALSSISHNDDATSEEWSVAFTGFVSIGGGGVTSADDMGLWIATPEGTVLALRENQNLQIGDTEKQLKTFAALKTLPYAPGQGNGISLTGGVAVQAFFKDGSQALLQVSSDNSGSGLAAKVEALALSGDQITDSDTSAASFGLPTQSRSGAISAWIGLTDETRKSTAVFQRDLNGQSGLRIVVQEGDAAPTIEGATISSLTNVTVNDAGSALFLGKIAGRQITTANDDVLWWKSASEGEFSYELLAREGLQASGAPEGMRWKAFTSVALADAPFGPLFTAKLSAPVGKGKQSWGSKNNDQGLWAVSSEGKLLLVVHEGEAIPFEGSSTPKFIKSFSVLSAVSRSATQRRSLDGHGQIVFRASFTDGSHAIMNAEIP